MESIGVRELRQHASRYLARVATGESIEVTDRGRPIALLVPVRPDPWDELIATGQVLPATPPGDLLEAGARDFGIDASGALADLRCQER